MKKFIFLFLIASTLVHAEQAEEPVIAPPSLPPQPEWNVEVKPKTNFSYFSLGTCGFVLPVMPEVAIGCRKLNSHHVWDVQGGVCIIPHTYAWGQLSYLYYFLPNTGAYSTPYMGAGLTAGYTKLGIMNIDAPSSHGIYWNLPVTMGYQWGDKGKNQFFQVQFTPVVITTLSYGVGF